MKSLLLSVSIAASLVLSPVALAEKINPAQEKQLTEISDLLRKNPEIIDGLYSNLTQYIDGQKSLSSVLEQNHDYLYNNPEQPYFGAENPKLTIINFTDYNCPYCKRLESGLVNIIKKYPEIRVVNVLLPFQQRMIPGLKTNTAWYALNVWENDKTKFAEVHRLMMAKPSRHDSTSIMKIADLTDTQKDLTPNQKKKTLVEKNEKIFSQLGLRGTPSLIIGSEIIPGFIPQDQLEATIKAQLK
ncbi:MULTISPECIES: DsbA family protein [Aliivibrio]|uniref:Disulfide bond formation protein DsbA n=2 Tax=Aliivibrio logei TaxID=688 RepID=A0A1B9P3D1_ALILO|nr:MULTISPECIES: DsbA family protein [Aliivibrio]MBB1313820.1 DsbA family protein [Aliivibrio sp. SR45-2]OCH23022.1 disulfide bond formation protein DsbA [Aliivibrio logei]OEF22383.1 disulfide bond formation protein DsbA [Aliivibrio logei 5S-186]